MNLYRVEYREWNTYFSDMYKCEQLSVGKTEQEAIDRVKEVVAKDARFFEAEKISNVFGYKVLFDDDTAQVLNEDKIDISTIASDVKRQKIFDMVMEEACRQWCDFIDKAHERKNGEGFADFFYEIFKEKEQEYLEDYKKIHKGKAYSQAKKVKQKIESEVVNDRQIIAAVDDEDNSVDIAVNVGDEPLVTLNVSVNEDSIKIRKWVGCGDGIDEQINIEDINEQQSDSDMTMR